MEISKKIPETAEFWCYVHCVKSVRIQSYSGPNAGKFGPE